MFGRDAKVDRIQPDLNQIFYTMRAKDAFLDDLDLSAWNDSRNALEKLTQIPSGLSTRWISAATPRGSPVISIMYCVTTAERLPAANGRVPTSAASRRISFFTGAGGVNRTERQPACGTDTSIRLPDKTA